MTGIELNLDLHQTALRWTRLICEGDGLMQEVLSHHNEGLVQGDMLSNEPKVRNAILKADVLFCNNFCFDDNEPKRQGSLNGRLGELLAMCMKPGAVIVTTHPLCATRGSFSEDNDIDATPATTPTSTPASSQSGSSTLVPHNQVELSLVHTFQFGPRSFQWTCSSNAWNGYLHTMRRIRIDTYSRKRQRVYEYAKRMEYRQNSKKRKVVSWD